MKRIVDRPAGARSRSDIHDGPSLPLGKDNVLIVDPGRGRNDKAPEVCTPSRPCLKLAPRVGFEPTTYRLTVECSTAELPGITARRGVVGLLQTLSRFAKWFFLKKALALFFYEKSPFSC